MKFQFEVARFQRGEVSANFGGKMDKKKKLLTYDTLNTA